MKSVSPINWNSNGLTITSINFNSGNNYSPWVDRVFGSKAFVRRPAFDDKPHLFFEFFKSNFTIQEESFWPTCSVELLGYGKHDVDEPLTNSIRDSHPATGYGTFQFGTNNDKWKCYYRALHDSWRFQNFHTAPNFWAIFFYCHPPWKREITEKYQSCESFSEYSSDTNKYVKYHIEMNLKTITWKNTFYGNIHMGDHIKYSISKKRKKPPVAICLVIPYAMDTSIERDVNGAFFIEFLRYYTLLGMKIFIFDRDGAHQQYLYPTTHPYMKKQNITYINSNIVYNNFTIRQYLDEGLLKNTSKTHQWYERIISDSTDDDKTNTLTYCRYEAKNVYHIDQIFVVDFDEFLYCPKGGKSISGQKSFIHNMIYKHRKEGYEQIEVEQRIILPKSNDPKTCLFTAVQNQNSIFSCFTSYKNYLGRNRRKSIHIGHSCPLTDFHLACSANYGVNNCICQDTFIANCAIVHFSLKNDKYEKWIREMKTKDKKFSLEKQKLNFEIYDIMTDRKNLGKTLSLSND